MNSEKNIFFYTCSFFCIFLISSARATILFTEDFSYTAGTLLTANGWTAHSAAGTNPIAVATPGLTYTGYPGSSVGNCVQLTTSGEDDNHTFDGSATITSGTVYASALINVSAAQATGDYFFHLMTSGTVYFYARVYIKSSGSGFVFGIAHGSSGPNYETTVYNFNTTYLIVIKYTFVAGSTTNDVAVW